MKPERPLRVFAGLLGTFFGLALLKFGNPPIMEKWVEAPANIYEWILGTPWPISWGYLGLGLVAFLGLWIALHSRLTLPSDQRWIVFLPLFWLGWQVLASTQSLDGNLSWPTLRHFVSCVVCFYLGFFVLSRVNELGSFWTGLAAGFLLMLATGWQQHFGGLQATREFFFREIYPHLKEVPPEYLKKMSSNRIFSTLFYPNALAGALLLQLPTMLAVLAQARQRFTLSARRFLVGAIGVGALACLYWSGSKGGWLLLLPLALIALLRVPFNRSVKLAVVVGVLIFGLAGFTWRYAAFFQKGATSVSARFDYWEAGLKTSVAHPWLGTGPGTFMIPYREIKRPESEMTRMVHNDYLEQASDSGWVGFILYALFMAGSLWVVGKRLVGGRMATAARGGQGVPARGPRSKPDSAEPTDWTPFCIWLGLLGWGLQCLFEFGLYIPALAWPAFTFLGLLLNTLGNPIDKTPPAR